MRSNYKKIGRCISLVDERNNDGSITNLTGLSIDKCYIPSVANVIGTDLKNYKIIRKGQFACSLTVYAIGVVSLTHYDRIFGES